MAKETYLNEVISPKLKLKKLGIDSKFVNLHEGLKEAVEKVDGLANVEVFWGRPFVVKRVYQTTVPKRRDPVIKTPAQSQEDRLGAVERSLEKILKTLDGLNRPVEGFRK